MPVTRFNSVVSPQRVFDTRRFELGQFKAIRNLVPGATVNDAVLAVCGGALRRYLAAHDELPDQSLTATAPIYHRSAKDAAATRELSWLRVRLRTEIADPVKRLRSIRRQMGASTTGLHAVGAQELTDIAQHLPAGTLAMTGKLLGRAMFGVGRRSPLANCLVVNVPGPAVPLYLIGARMTYFSAIMPIYDGMGLVLAVTSYDGKIIVSPTSCRELLPDPEVFSQCLRDSFQEYLALAGWKPEKAAKAPVKRASRTGSRAGKPPPRARTARKASSAPRAAQAGRPRSRAPSG
jgi:WS/DGAT/MGAT family acyltransferase